MVSNVLRTHGALLPLVLFVLLGPSLAAQTWTPVEADDLAARAQERRIMATNGDHYRVDPSALRTRLAGVSGTGSSTLSIPMPGGGQRTFRVWRTHLLHPELQAQFPGIITLAGQDAADASVLLRADITVHGFHAMVSGLPGETDLFMEPVFVGNDSLYQMHRSGSVANLAPWACGVVDELEQVPNGARSSDGLLRSYRLALACTGEYAQYHGGTVAGALSAMATTMNRVNGLFERDAAITMQLVAGNAQLVYLNGATDPFTNDDGYAMLDENVATCNAVIGWANYDLGHVFSTGGGGVAYLGSVCGTWKGGGVTGSSAPVGDAFDVDYVAHEMGHQFGANHTQNNSCNRASTASCEVGSGITIMGYAGICAPNVANNSIAMFGGRSLEEIKTFTTSASHGCAQTSPITAVAPHANAGVDRVIPKGTPFRLDAVTLPGVPVGTTYSWEQMDRQVATQPPTTNNTSGPAFRPFLPRTEAHRYFPDLAAVVLGSTPTWEVLANVGRVYNFRLTVRNPGVPAGQVAQDDMLVTVNATAGPFLVTQPNTAVQWTANTQHTVQWNVAGTTASPVSCANVDILLSTDGGTTYPHILASATPNDGSQVVTLPNISSSTARVMVRANGNVFYDISNTNFSISGATLVRLSPKLWLGGAYNTATGTMGDGLRSAGLLPTTEPYTAAGWPSTPGAGGEHMAASLLNVQGNNAIVDWVRVELRDPQAPAVLLAVRHALLQRDGDVVDTDGSSPVVFPLAPGAYHVALRHRNHLGCMTATPLTLAAQTQQLDMGQPSTPTHGTNARKIQSGVAMLWPGNAVADAAVAYTGSANDRDALLIRVGGGVPTATTVGYWPEDVDLDGVVRYTGTANDRDPILQTIGGAVPTVVRQEQMP